jgi:hypothetical protein
MRKHSAAVVYDGSRNAAERLLGLRAETESNESCEECGDGENATSNDFHYSVRLLEFALARIPERKKLRQSISTYSGTETDYLDARNLFF